MNDPIINPFSREYASQIKPFRKIPYKRPKLDQVPDRARLVDPDAPSEEGKRYRLLKARI